MSSNSESQIPRDRPAEVLSQAASGQSAARPESVLSRGTGDLPVAIVLDLSQLPEGIVPETLPVAELITPPTGSPAMPPGEVSVPGEHRAAEDSQSLEASPSPSQRDAQLEQEAATAPQIAVEMVPPGATATAATQLAASPTEPVVAVEIRSCPACGCALPPDSQFCHDCGYSFPDGEVAAVPTAALLPLAEPLPAGSLVADRYEIVQEMSRRLNTVRYQARARHADNRPVILVQQGVGSASGRTVCVGRFTLPAEVGTAWPELGWEIALLEQLQHPNWPRVLEVVREESSVFAVEEAANGPDLWQVFDDPAWTMPARFDLLAEFAESLKTLADAGAIPEYFKPELLRLNERGRLMLTDLSLLVPLPYPARQQLASTPYTPPELVLDAAAVDARSPLYSFGAVLYALYLGHELTENDFERQWTPKPLVFRFPDVPPAYARLIMKTFVRDKEHRFPTEEAARRDRTGWEELASALRSTGRQLSITRLDVAGWSNIGKLRSNNEDAFAVWHGSAGLEETLGETLLAVLCDGMGGYEAGEVAAALAIREIRQRFLSSDYARPLLGELRDYSFDVEACRKFLFDLLREVNQQIYRFSRSPQGKRGMGCTCELLYLHGAQAVIAHVGDSRTYHYSGGQLRQLTRDQTLVNRLVELGHLTPEEAEHHPRKNELQQALGAQPFVEPQTLSLTVQPGDWLILCSDGLTNHVDDATLAEMIQRADSAEMCARRLINLANAYGGSDNTTVIAVRCQ